MDDYEQWLADRWAAAFDTATGEVLEILPGLNPQKLRDTIEEAHTEDDPEWRFNSDRLVETILDGRIVDDLVYEAIEAIFPVSP